MSKKNFFFTFIFVLLLGFTFNTSCSPEIFPEPNFGNSDDIPTSGHSKSILPPEGLTASHGKSSTITLSWNHTSKAVQYLIFEADSPFTPFTQVAETRQNELSIDLAVDPGTSKYYAVCAIDEKANISSLSRIVYGSSLATPLITEIIPLEDGESVEIYWFMENCSKETYKNDVYFCVHCTDANGKEIDDINFTIIDSESALVTGLKGNTAYKFYIEASTPLVGGLERCNAESIETAKQTIPSKVKELSAEQGIKKSGIKLSWKLPNKIGLQREESFDTIPLYFTVSRKRISEPDSAYREISGKLRPAEYTEGAVFEYTDTTAKRGEQYTYKVQSYGDVENKTITSPKSSIAYTDGWLLSPLKVEFMTETLFSFDAETNTKTLTGTKIILKSDFDDYSLSNKYSYVLTKQKSAFGTGILSPEKLIFATNNFDEIKEYTYTERVSDSDFEEGYYSYSIYAAPYDTTSIPSDYFDKVTTSNKATIIKDIDNLPEIKNFVIQDGFKNKYVLSWDYTPAYNYTLIYTTNQSDEKIEVPVDNSKLTINRNTATYEVPAESDEIRYYYLKASAIRTIGTAANVEIENTVVYENNPVMTLGVPVLENTSLNYNSITLKFPKVQKVENLDDYSVTAWYTSAPGLNLISDNYTVEEIDDYIYITITEPYGYNDITKGGKEITAQVAAKNIVTNDSTTASIQTRTLGPAELNTAVSTTTYGNKISISWNEIPGVNAYAIYRFVYDIKENDTNIRTVPESRYDVYIFDGNELKAGETKITGETKVTKNNSKFTFDDSDTDCKDDTDSYQINQSKLSWGIPFGYIVLPLKDSNEKASTFAFNVNDNGKIVTRDTSKINFGEIKPVVSATYGYGLNVSAEKSKSADTQVIKWVEPYYAAKGTPAVYRRAAGSSKNEWEKVSTANFKQNEGYATITITDENKAAAFEYMIGYNKNKNVLSNSLIDNAQKQIETSNDYDYTGKNSEIRSKGYLLTLKDFDANPGANASTTPDNTNYYTEVVTWDLWDYDERSIGPDSVEIQILNKNSSAGWIKVADLDNEGKITSTSTLENTSVSKNLTELTLQPNVLANDTDMPVTKGPLQVLRDYKHYYRAVLKRITASSTPLQCPQSKNDDSEEIYAYRNISEIELAKCIGLILADCFTQSGISSGGTTSITGSSGRFKTNHPSATQKFSWGFENSYIHIFRAGLPSQLNTAFTSGWSISSNMSSEQKESSSGTNLFAIAQNTLTITHETDLPSYSCTYLFQAGEHQALYAWTDPIYLIAISINGKQIVNEKNEAKFLSYFPYKLRSSNGDTTTSFKDSLPIFKSPWWNY